MNHTPAPWNIYEDNSGDVWHKPIITAWDGEDESSFGVAFPAHDIEHDEMVANARLIATAPEMLAVLQQTVSNMYDSGFSEYETKPLQDVINKATGES